MNRPDNIQAAIDYGNRTNMQGIPIDVSPQETANLLATIKTLLAYITSLENSAEWQPIETLIGNEGEVIFLNQERNMALSMDAAHWNKTRNAPEHLRFLASHWRTMSLPENNHG